jgi:molecular chaperone HscB
MTTSVSATGRALSRIGARYLRPTGSSALFIPANQLFSTSSSSKPVTSRQATCCCNQRRRISHTTRRTRPASSTRANDAAGDFANSSSQIPITHYDFFPTTLPDGPPPTGHFPIDVRALRREFLQLQAKAHPDRHPQEGKARAEALSARINEAFKTLQNPLLRAQYLLSLRGINIAEDETAKVEDPELLLDVLEARESIEEAHEASDLEGIRQVNDERIRLSEAALENAFRGDDMETAKHESVKLRYWVNIKDALDNWEPGKPIVLQH